MKAYVFPGQGSQMKGMGKGLFEDFPKLTAMADSILGYSIKELCLDDSKRQLGQTQFTQPALFVTNALTFQKKQQEDKDNELPSYFAGHSLGEYNALFAAGAFDFGTGIHLVKKRGELMSQAKKGTMAAVLNCSEDLLMSTLKANALNTIDVANFNAPSQIVIAGLSDEIQKAESCFKDSEAVFIPLNVSAAFHSRYMQESMEKFENFLQDINFSEPQMPVISNINARPYDFEHMKSNLSNQIRCPVKWTESIRYLMGQGVTEFHELGPGDVLTKLIEKIQQEATPLVIEETPPEKEKITKKGMLSCTSQRKTLTKSETQNSDMINKKTNNSIKRNTSKTPTAPKTSSNSLITPESLGSEEFKNAYNLRYAYASGAMYKGIASKELVVRMGKAGFIGYYGTGGVKLSEIEENIRYIQSNLNNGMAYGMNLLCNLIKPELEIETVDLFLRYEIKNIEAAAYMQITPALVKYRLKGLERNDSGEIRINHRIMAKISRPEVAHVFLSPPPERVLNKMLEQGQITQEEASLSKDVPMADDLCVEADSGGHTDMGIVSVLMPTIIRLRDELHHQHKYATKVRVGTSGGIGTPEAAGAAFILGADFILTGSINQCTVESGMNDVVKDMLVHLNVQDTDYAPAGDMFELGAKIQVMKKGVFFPARATKLYTLWRQYDSLDAIDEKTRKQIQDKYFKRSFDEVYAETKDFYLRELPSEIEKAERNPKHKMALIFRWYFIHTMRLAMRGIEDQRVDFQVHCGPSLGAFNQWVKGTDLESWRHRHVDAIGEKLMIETANILNKRFQCLAV